MYTLIQFPPNSALLPWDVQLAATIQQTGHGAVQDLLALATGFPVLLKLLCLPQKHFAKA